MWKVKLVLLNGVSSVWSLLEMLCDHALPNWLDVEVEEQPANLILEETIRRPYLYHDGAQETSQRQG